MQTHEENAVNKLAWAIVIGAVIIAASIVYLASRGGVVSGGNAAPSVAAPSAQAPSAPSAPSAPPAPTAKVNVSAGDSPVMGKKNAPVTIIEFSDFQCPFCERFFTQTLPQIKSNYIDTGKVKLVFREFPLPFHENAKPAAVAALCVKEQSDDAGFYKFHDLIFQNQATLSKDNLKVWAKQVGVDMTKWQDCFDNQKTASIADKDQQEGQAAGVNGTPAFFVNGHFISGAQPFSVFQTAIDAELK